MMKSFNLLYYHSIPEFFHATAIIPMQVLCYYTEKCSTHNNYLYCYKLMVSRVTNIPPTGIHLSLFFILLLSLRVRMSLSSYWSLFALSSVSWLCLVYLLPLNSLLMCLFSHNVQMLLSCSYIPIFVSFSCCKWWKCTEACAVLRQ